MLTPPPNYEGCVLWPLAPTIRPHREATAAWRCARVRQLVRCWCGPAGPAVAGPWLFQVSGTAPCASAVLGVGPGAAAYGRGAARERSGGHGLVPCGAGAPVTLCVPITTSMQRSNAACSYPRTASLRQDCVPCVRRQARCADQRQPEAASVSRGAARGAIGEQLGALNGPELYFNDSHMGDLAVPPGSGQRPPVHDGADHARHDQDHGAGRGDQG